MKSINCFLVFAALCGAQAQQIELVPPCVSDRVAVCSRNFCFDRKCPGIPEAVCVQRGCDGNCDPEFFFNGVKLTKEQCEGRCKGGKFTQWFNRDRPSGDGDYETLLHLRKQFPEKICDHPSHVDARVISTGVPHYLTGQITYTSTTGGFWCNNKDNKGSCLDYEVRFCCPDAPHCPEGAWTNYFNRDKPSATCDCETLANLRVEYKGQICKKPTAIDARVVDTGLPYQSAGQIIKHADTVKGFRCDNSKTQQCVDYEVRFCCPEVPKPKCEKNGWTPWLNSDSPSTGTGDIEDLAILQTTYQELICAEPTAVDARVRFTHESYLTVNQDLDVSPAHGLICLHGLNQRCYDYEVRFCCPDHTIPEPECKNGKWTDYYNIDTPDDKGDFETLGAIRELAPEAVCSNPTNVDVRVALTGASYLTAAQQVVVDPTSGFYCENAAQSGEFCEDYKIRFCCPNDCEEVKCANSDWTRFFDVDDPDKEGDIELIASINQATGGEVCSMPTAIDARLLNGDHYATMNQVVHVSVADGFACYNSDDQTCCDYKVRFCCPGDVSPPGNDVHWCTAWGDPHYTTLDGLAYDFQGECLYDFLSTIVPLFNSDLQPFSVWTENRGCGIAVTCVRTVTIRIYDQTIDLLQGGAVELDGGLLSLPYEDVANQWSISAGTNGELTLSTSFGLTVLFDGLHTVKVGVPETYMRQVHGLCGNFNGDVTDEFRLRNSDIVTQNVNSFAISHAMQAECPFPIPQQPCPFHQWDETYRQLRKFCEGILDHSCFHDCAGHIQSPSKEQILQACYFDFCYQSAPWNVVKSTIGVTEATCKAEGYPSCGNPNLVYNDEICSNVSLAYYDECAHPNCQPICSSFSSGSQFCPDSCGSGDCVCPAGMYLDIEQRACITEAECHCKFTHHFPGLPEVPFLVDNCTRSCICADGGVICEDFECSTSCVESQCLEEVLPRSCRDVHSSDVLSGVFVIYPFGDRTPLEVYCDLETDGGDWLVFQRRLDGSENFNRGWDEYVNGFGSMDGEFWLGLENLNQITQSGAYEMRVDMSDFNDSSSYAYYGSFSVNPSSTNYSYVWSHFSGPAGHGLTGSGTPFSTYDNELDSSPRNCAELFRGGWWYGSCHNGNPNGVYLTPPFDEILENGFGITWIGFRGHFYSLKTIEMKIRSIVT